MLWTAGYSDFPLPERIAAAAAAAYPMFSVSSVEAVDLGAVGLRELAARCRDHGVQPAALDPVVTWLPADPAWRYARASLDDVDQIADALDVPALCAIAGRDHGLAPGELADRFGALCDRAARSGRHVALEFAPGSGVTSLDAALRLVAGAGRANVSVLFDSWHFFRTGGTPERLAAAMGRIRFVQLSDAPAQPAGSVGRDMYHRLRPGTGDIGLVAVVRALAAAGAFGGDKGAWGPEVITPHPDGVDCAQAVVSDSAALDAVLAAAFG
jgi:sugar phosphate isomerase/epimerase